MPSLKKKPSATVLVKRKGTKVVQKLNPFEVRINKKKHDVLGQKSKSDKGLPGVARSKAVKKRKKTLLVEYQQRNKTNEFVDRRFGEYNDDLTAEEKMMKRFTLKRKRKHERSSLFTLNDDDEEGLTHYGRSIGGMEKFDHIELSENELEDEDIGDTHFGGFLRKKQKISETEDDVKPDRLRSRKEIMEEVVAKSKAMKYKQQSEKQDVEELLDKINTDWKSLQTTLPFASDGSKGQKLKTDDYDKTVRELAYEKRGQPTDRMKTEEEIAKEEKEKLEKREADRVRRMKGVIPSGDDMTTESADYIRDQPIVKKKVQFTLRYKDGKIVQEEGGPSVYEAVGRRGERRDPSDVGGESDSDEDCEGDDASDATGDGDVCEGGDVSDSSEGGDPGDEYGSDLESDVSDHESDIEELNQPIIKGPSKAEIKKMKKLASKEVACADMITACEWLHVQT
ncbi:nucleolar protein 14-like [Halichondria panicea]|uniref:nucleolar protein 14-like n=1 Tax=Halichondria panicea TaxID=6063 RepID=UPI00312B936B